MRIKWRFVKHGELPVLDDNELAVDISSITAHQDLLFDHHSSPGEEYKCSAAMVYEKRNQLNTLKEKEEVIINCHLHPDADCAVSSFLVVCQLQDLTTGKSKEQDRGGKILDNEPLIRQLVHIIGEIDQGKIFPLSFESGQFDFNFYTFFLLLDDFIKGMSSPIQQAPGTGNRGIGKKENPRRNWYIIEDYLSAYGLDLCWDSWQEQFMAYSFVFLHQLLKSENPMVYLTLQETSNCLPSLGEFLVSGNVDEELKPVFLEISAFIKETVNKGRKEAINMFKQVYYETFMVKTTSRLKINEIIDTQVLYVRLPFSALPLLKALRGVSFDFVQNRKIDILAFEPEEEEWRVIISVDPNSNVSLKGLGLALDRKSTRKARGRRVKISREWRVLEGKKCPDPLFPYQDPWYDGRGFDFTIVDAPSARSNRYLNSNDIKEVLKSEWYQLAQEYETDSYKEWLSGEEVKKNESI